VATETITRTHGAGTFDWTLVNYEKSSRWRRSSPSSPSTSWRP